MKYKLDDVTGEKVACLPAEDCPQNGAFVPVSFVAKDWGVSTRRIRALLSSGRLGGRQQANGYWEVCYPFRHVMGRRAPPLKRTQREERKAEC